jgi:hypothetical protein
MINLSTLNLVLLSLLVHVNTFADENITFDAHVHGLSEMTVAIDKDVLDVEITSPAINLVGFEHKVKTKEDKHAVKNAKLLLNNPEKVLLFSGGDCELINQSIDISSIIATHNHTEKKHEKQHMHKDSGGGSHSEVIASYRYQCKKISTLNTITVTVFKLFSGINKVQALWITESQQGATTLSAKNNVINLR